MGRRVATFLLLLAVTAAGVARYADELAHSGLPQRRGRALLEGLSAPVEVRFDARGVPHVRADEPLDLARALGFLHANDRAFQLELGRRAAAGRLAELFGAAALEVDVEARTLGLRAVAAASVARSSPRARAWYAAYAEGVNAWLAARGDDLPPELRLLGVRPEPWTPTDSASFALLMARDLSQPGSYERTNLDWLRSVGPERLAELLGVDDLHLPAGLLERLATARAGDEGAGDEGARADGARADGARADGARADGARAEGPAPVRGGSNNWAVGAARSAGDGALLAGDPHLRLGLPAQFFLVRLSAPGFEAFGATLPGHPALVIGRSDRRAWSLTTTGLDDDDLTLEELAPDGAAVRRPDGWLPLEARVERFDVRGGGPVERTVRRSDRGPLLEADPAGAGLEAWPRSLAWTALEASDSLEPFLALVVEERPETVRAALADFVAPAQNLLVAERDGGSWYTVMGRAPLRRRGDGRLPSLGSEPGYGWEGLAEQAWNPLVEGDAQAVLWTANQDVRPDGRPRELFARWAPPERAERIGAALSGRERWTVDDFAALQLDLRSVFATRLVAALREEDVADDPAAAEVLWRLRGWDGTLAGAEGALFALCVQSLTEAVFDEPLHPERLAGPDARKLESALVRVLEGRYGEGWFDRVHTPEVEGRSAVVASGLAAALARGRELFGGAAFEHWDLARLQTLTLRHPLSALPGLAPLLDRGPFGLAGHGSTIAALWRRWTGSGWDVVGGAALRFVTDVGAPVGTRAVLPGGQSGHPFDPHYADQLGAWLAGRLFEGPWLPPADGGARRLELRPAER